MSINDRGDNSKKGSAVFGRYTETPNRKRKKN